jgi:ankyrin repeat protein
MTGWSKRKFSAMLFFAYLASSSSLMAGPIHEAAKAGEVAQVEILIQAGADVDEKDAGSKTALHWAADLGHIGVVQVLVANGTNVDAKDFSGMTGLFLASLGSREGIVRLLIAEGANVNAKEMEGMTALDGAYMRGINASIVEMLKRAGAKCGTNQQYSKRCKAAEVSE